jgi:orotidine-5'-phosphate decarboxylase
MALVTRAIVALDVPSAREAQLLVERLGDECDYYKVGLELFAADGPAVVEWLRGAGKSVFVDLKAHDIPNTVRGVAARVAALGASLFTVHGIGGEAMIRAAVEGAGEQSGAGCGVLVVTVLTSFDTQGYSAALGRATDIAHETARLSSIAHDAGAHGVVCSGQEAGKVRAQFSSLATLVPGVRPAGSPTHDQARVVTPADAAATGVTYVVLGRAVTTAADPRGVLGAIKRDLARTTS